MHELLKFFWLVSTELFNGRLLLLFLDVSILFGLGATGKTLPREGTAQEIEQNVTNCLKIVSTRLLITEMRVDRGISCSTSEVLTISEGNMLAVGRLEALGKTEINNVDRVLRLVVTANQEVVRLDITMDNALLVHHLDTLDHLNGDVQDSLEVELAAALLEQVLKRLTKQIHDHHVIHLAILGLLITNEMQIWNRRLAAQLMDELRLPEEHDMLLVLHGLLNLGSKEVSGLPLLYFVKLTECTAT